MTELSFCLVTTFYPPHHFGGDAVHAQRLANALARRGHRVTVLHSEDAYKVLGGRSAGDDLGRGWEPEPDVRVLPLRTSLPLASTLTTYLSGRPGFYAPDVESLFREERFDVVHFHNVSLAGGPGVLRYGQGVKLYTTSEHWLVCPMHVLFRNNREPCIDPHCLRCTLAFRRPPQLWRYSTLLDRSLSHVDLFLSPSRFTLQAHRDRGFTRPMRVLPHFLPADTSGPDREGTEGGQIRDRPTFLFVGRLERIKGAHMLVEAFRSFSGADLVIAGDGEERDGLRRQAAGLENVRFLGRVSQDELAHLYADATALVVPSVGYEVFGLVVLEAFAHGTPVVVNDLGALPELVEDSGGGLVYRTQTELLEALNLLVEDKALRDRLGAAGRVALERLWSEDVHVEAYFAAIDEARALRAQRSGNGTVAGASSKSSGTRDTA